VQFDRLLKSGSDLPTVKSAMLDRTRRQHLRLSGNNMKIFRIIGAMLGVMLALYLWMCSINLLDHDPLGTTSPLGYWTFFSPFLGVFLPGSLKLMNAGCFVRGIWLLTLAPVVGVMNYGLPLLLAVATGIRPDPWNLPVLLAIAIWAVPAVPLYWVLIRSYTRHHT
jgi:hypothetical protein